MVTCEAAESLIVREADGLLTSGERERLERHAAGCGACHALREANLAVKTVLRQRVDAEVPPAFSARTVARAMPQPPGDWLGSIDWRRWTEWMVPVAAGLALLAVMAGGAAQTVSPEVSNEPVLAEAVETADDVTAGGVALGEEATSEELLAAMLGHATAAAEGVTTHGR